MITPRDIPVDRTPLPGVGLRLELMAADGNRLGVIHLQQGGIELFISRSDDPDLAAASVTLTPREAATLIELFGGSSFSHELSHLQEAAAGVAVDWLTIEHGEPYVARSLGDTRLRTRTGVSIVAVVRDGSVEPSPTPQFVFAAGDVLVAVGTADGLARAGALIRGEP